MGLSEPKIVEFLDNLYLRDGEMYKFPEFPNRKFLMDQVKLIKDYLDNVLFIEKSIVTFTPVTTTSFFIDYTITISWIDSFNNIRQIVEPIYW